MPLLRSGRWGVVTSTNISPLRGGGDGSLLSYPIFTLHQTSFVRPRRDVLEENVMRKRTKLRVSFTDQYRNMREDDPVDQTRSQKSLDRDPAVNVSMSDPACFKLRDDVLWIT